MYISIITIFISLFQTVLSWEVHAYEGPTCTSGTVFDQVYSGAQEDCVSILSHGIIQSFAVVKTNDNDADYVVVFYNSDDCYGSGQPTVTVGTDQCVQMEDKNLYSYVITPNTSKTGKKLRRHNYIRDSNNTDLVTYSNPPKHDINNYESAGVSRLSVKGFYITATVTFVTGSFSFASLVTGCIGVTSATTVSQFSCWSSLASTVISYTVSVISGAIAVSTRVYNIAARVGIIAGGIHDNEKRSEIEYDEINEWLQLTLSAMGHSSKHIGSTTRTNLGNTTIPVHEFMGVNNVGYHLSAHIDSSGGLVHTLSFARDSKIYKRQDGYDSVHTAVDGGLDFSICGRAGADTSIFPSTPEQAYNAIYSDIRCLLSDDILSGNYLQSDIFDEYGQSAATISMSAYSSSSGSILDSKNACENSAFGDNQLCRA